MLFYDLPALHSPGEGTVSVGSNADEAAWIVSGQPSSTLLPLVTSCQVTRDRLGHGIIKDARTKGLNFGLGRSN